jgi:predicted secreted protein
MRKAALLLFAAALVASRASAAEITVTSSDNHAPMLHLTERAERAVGRDEIHVQLRVEAANLDPRTAQAEVNRLMAAALAKAKSAPAVKVETGGYDTYQFTPEGPDGKPKPPPQWRASESLELSGRDSDAVLAVAGALQGDGLILSGLRFDVSADTVRGLQDALTDEALARLRGRAAKIASAMGMRVAAYRSLNVGNAGEQGVPPRPVPMMAMRAGAAMPPPAAEAGETAISLTVSAEIELAPGN